LDIARGNRDLFCVGRIREIPGGTLMLIPWTVTVGLALPGCTMASAALPLIFVAGHPADSVFSGGLFIALAFFWWNRRNG
jgi:hypothetical protein